LEALAGRRYILGEKEGSRTAIRMMLGYGYGTAFPLFQVASDAPIEIDHIEIAGIVRDHLFHGFAAPKFQEKHDVGRHLYEQRPEFLAFALSCDCMKILLAGTDTRPLVPAPAPARNIPLDGYRFHLVTESRRHGFNLGVWIRRGEKRGSVLVACWFRDFAGGGLGPFRITLPPGQGPTSAEDELGYGIALIDH
jgi:hypothetical protein